MHKLDLEFTKEQKQLGIKFVDISTQQDTKRAYKLIRQLVPSLKSEKHFLEIIEKKRINYGYNLVGLERDKTLLSIAGYRFNEYYALGKLMFVDDLVTDELERSKGYGEKLFRHLILLAKNEGCKEIHLDTSINLNLAHKFYYKIGMKISHFHLTMPV